VFNIPHTHEEIQFYDKTHEQKYNDIRYENISTRKAVPMCPDISEHGD
jgi:hypothetical protein